MAVLDPDDRAEFVRVTYAAISGTDLTGVERLDGEHSFASGRAIRHRLTGEEADIVGAAKETYATTLAAMPTPPGLTREPTPR